MAFKYFYAVAISSVTSNLLLVSNLIYHILTYSFQGNITYHECNQERLLSPLINRARLSICFLSEDTRPGLCIVLLSFLSFPLPSLSLYISTVPSTPTILHAWPATFFVPFMPIFRRAIRRRDFPARGIFLSPDTSADNILIYLCIPMSLMGVFKSYDVYGKEYK